MPSRQQLDLGAPGDQPLARLQYLNTVGTIRRDDRHAHQRPPVQLEMPCLCGTHLEPAPELSHDRPHDRPLLLQRMNIPEQEIKGQLSDKHETSPFPSFNPNPAATT